MCEIYPKDNGKIPKCYAFLGFFLVKEKNMLKYTIRRMIQSVITIFLIATIVFPPNASAPDRLLFYRG